MLTVKTVEETFQIIKDQFSSYSLENEEIMIDESCGRILGVDIYAPENIPDFNKSSVDGYAVFASDTYGASESIPSQLIKINPVEMGVTPDFPLKQGCASYIPTGGELPQNADATVMIEYTEDNDDEYIYINKSVAPGNNVIFIGDDVKINEKILSAGKKINSADIGMLAALGIDKIRVKKIIKVGIIATGNEIIPIENKIKGSQVRDINSHFLFSLLNEYNTKPIIYGIIKDEFELIKNKVQLAIEECDIVCISGGSSAGEKDMTAKIINSLGSPGVLIHGIAVKPGKPTIIGKINNNPIVGLPGHPASAFMIFKIFVTNIIDILNKNQNENQKFVFASIKNNYSSNNGREEFLPVKIIIDNDEIIAYPILGKSGQIKMLSDAHGYVHINRESEGLTAGQIVKIILF